MTTALEVVRPSWALRLRDLSVSLGGQPILEAVNLEVAAGSLHAVIGPNGAGKTTLIRSLLGLLPHRGEIRFRFRASGRIGYVPQGLETDREVPMTVGDLLGVMLSRRPAFLGASRRRRDEMARLLARTGAESLLERPLSGLSGGEWRRVLLAQALAPLPEVLLLDEPASQVDEAGARLIEDLLRELVREEGMTVILVGHDIPAILRCADRVTAINRCVTYDGDPEPLRDPRRLSRLFDAGPEAALPGFDPGAPAAGRR